MGKAVGPAEGRVLKVLEQQEEWLIRLFRRWFPYNPERAARRVSDFWWIVFVVSILGMYVRPWFGVVAASISLLLVRVSEGVDRKLWKIDALMMANAAANDVSEDLHRAVGSSHDDSGRPLITVSLYDADALSCLIDTSSRTVEELAYRDGPLLNDLRPPAGVAHVDVIGIRRPRGTLFEIRYEVNTAFSEESHAVELCLLRNGVSVCHLTDLRPTASSKLAIFVPGGDPSSAVGGRLMVIDKATGTTLSSLSSRTVAQVQVDGASAETVATLRNHSPNT